MIGVVSALKAIRWVLFAGFCLGVVSFVLATIPDQNLNSLGDGLKTLAQALSDLPQMLTTAILALVGIFVLKLVLRGND